jgi:sugar/nucleoside kinase (ribokinase family)
VPKFDIAIVGELNPDLIFYGVPRELPEERELLSSGFSLTLGSSSAILAHNLSLLGTKVKFAACVGRDAFGELCCQTLREAGVNVSDVVYAPEGVNTGVTVILPLENTRRILTYPGAMFELSLEHLNLDHLALAGHFHLSSLFLHRKLSPDIPHIFHEMAKRGMTTSLDTNDDPEGKWGGVLGDVLKLINILFCTERELLSISGKSDLEAAEKDLAGRIPILVVKRGSRGATAFASGTRIDAEAVRVTLRDQVGAGDSFDAGFLHEWLKGRPLRQCLAYGNVAGALCVTRSGGIEAFKDAEHRTEFIARHFKQ